MRELTTTVNGRLRPNPPFRTLLLCVSGRISGHRQDAIAYLLKENRILHETSLKAAGDRERTTRCC